MQRAHHTVAPHLGERIERARGAHRVGVVDDHRAEAVHRQLVLVERARERRGREQHLGAIGATPGQLERLVVEVERVLPAAELQRRFGSFLENFDPRQSRTAALDGHRLLRRGELAAKVTQSTQTHGPLQIRVGAEDFARGRVHHDAERSHGAFAIPRRASDLRQEHHGAGRDGGLGVVGKQRLQRRLGSREIAVGLVGARLEEERLGRRIGSQRGRGARVEVARRVVVAAPHELAPVRENVVERLRAHQRRWLEHHQQQHDAQAESSRHTEDQECTCGLRRQATLLLTMPIHVNTAEKKAEIARDVVVAYLSHVKDEELSDLGKVGEAITRLVDVVDQTFEVTERGSPGFGMSPSLPRQAAKHE